ncbi:MAG TPA: type IVB secretion system coupling complex protein DotM/IcmP [Gammaproteobacteria bacterium]|nr:type IVB secretion system coupling complex protein DotM/IcmP [Gammaproteobacteria bacterium]
MQGRQQGGNGDNSMDMLWIGGVLIAFVLGIWYFGRFYIIQTAFFVKYYEINVINYVLGAWNLLAHKASLPEFNLTLLKELQAQIQTRSIGTNYSALQIAMTMVGQYLCYPLGLVMVILAFIIHGKNITLKLRNVFSMKTMKQMEQKENPQIAPVIKLSLAKENVNQGNWAMAMTPMQYCKHMKLLKEKKSETGAVTVELLRSEAQQAFVLQLGPLWSGVETLPLHAKALFAAFAAFGNQDRAGGMRLLQHISGSAAEGQLNFDGTHALLAKHKDSKLVAKVISRHAYILTVFATMLELARTDGVFATSEFLWLKPLNRRLWYVLNTVGRQTAVPEVGGVYAHWIAEKKWGGALRTPMVEEAVKGLEIALSEVIYEAEEE